MKQLVPLEVRFWSHVQKRGPNECWPWTAGTQKGYGAIKPFGKPVMRAHRLSWEIHNGPIPNGLWVLHKCDNPPCCNPNHLFLGDRAANMQDMIRKGRRDFAKGEDVPASKLTNKQVESICLEWNVQPIKQALCQRLANKYGVGRMVISGIVNGHTWRHITKKLISVDYSVYGPKSKKLTPNNVRQIVKMCTGQKPHQRGRGITRIAAERFGITDSAVCSILSGKCWNHVTGFASNRPRRVS